VPFSRPMAPPAASTEERPGPVHLPRDRLPARRLHPRPEHPRRGQLFHPVPADRAPAVQDTAAPPEAAAAPAAAGPGAEPRAGTAPGSLGRHGEAGLAADTHGAPPAGRRVLVVEASPRGPAAVPADRACRRRPARAPHARPGGHRRRSRGGGCLHAFTAVLGVQDAHA
jgi:hypothetical protein